MTVPAVIANAVSDALSPLGIRINELPMTPDPPARLIGARARGGRSARPARETTAFDYHAPRTVDEALALLAPLRRRGEDPGRRPEPDAAAQLPAVAARGPRRPQPHRRAGPHPRGRRPRAVRRDDAPADDRVLAGRRAAPAAARRGHAVGRPSAHPHARHHRRLASPTPTRRRSTRPCWRRSTARSSSGGRGASASLARGASSSRPI